MIVAHDTRTFKELPLKLLDRPGLDARIARDPEKLEELARDILRRGLIYPIAVVPVGERYEVVDGQRRYLACKSAGLTTVMCVVYPTKNAAIEGVKYAANAFREDMSPAEEAVFFHELLVTECGHDIEQVCALVNKRLSYVDDRLALLNGDELVFEALRARSITVGVAHELNKITTAEHRRYYLHHAVDEGATIAVVNGWVGEWRKMFGGPAAPAMTATEPAVIVPQPASDPFQCVICGKSDQRFIPEQLSVHTHCKLAILEPLLESARAGSSAE